MTLSKIFDKIEDALGIVFEDDASKIVVRGDSGSGKWQYIGNGCKAGKQAHMASAGNMMSWTSLHLSVFEIVAHFDDSLCNLIVFHSCCYQGNEPQQGEFEHHPL